MDSWNVLGGLAIIGGVVLYIESRARCSHSLLLWYLHPTSASAQLVSLLGKLLLAIPQVYSVAEPTPILPLKRPLLLLLP